MDRAFESIHTLSEVDFLAVYETRPTLPEKRLMFAILLDAVECFQQYAGHEDNRLFIETEDWVSEDDRGWVFSFINVCEALEIDPQYLRKGLLHWKERKILESEYR
jgi:hypothetical protein